MFKFWKSQSEKDKENEKLIIALKKVARPKLSTENRERLRKNILYAVNRNDQAEFMPASLRQTAIKINQIGRQVSLPASAAVKIKERLIGFIERNPLFGLSSVPTFRYLRMAMSSLLLLIFSFTAVFVMPYQVPKAFAQTYIDEVKGDVYVSREGRLIEAVSQLALREGDKIITRGDGFATVHFFDDSVSRLGENTDVEIKKLYSEPLHPMVSEVQLYLAQGRLWSRVINMINDHSEFTVETPTARANVSKKAAFDLYTGGNETKLAVFDNVVDVTAVDGGNSAKTVVAGYAAVAAENSAIELEAMDPEDPEVKAAKKWVIVNMRSDKAYDQQVATDVAANVMKAGEGNEENIPVFANAQIEEQKVIFLQHYEELLRAEALFLNDSRQEGLEALRQFSQGVTDIFEKMPQFETEDAFNSGLLRNLINEKIAEQLNAVSVLIPGDKLYAVKEALRQLELVMAADDSAGAHIKLSQAESKLLEIQELLKEEKIEFATTLLREYQQALDQVVLRLDADDPKVADTLVPLVTQQVQQIKILTAVEQSLSDGNEEEFRQKVADIRASSLQKLLEALERLKGTIPSEITFALKDIFDSYFDVSSADSDLINATFERLIGSGDGLNFIQPDEGQLPSEVGVVMIVPTEATPDILATETVLGPIEGATQEDAPSAQEPVSTQETQEENIVEAAPVAETVTVESNAEITFDPVIPVEDAAIELPQLIPASTLDPVILDAAGGEQSQN